MAPDAMSTKHLAMLKISSAEEWNERVLQRKQDREATEQIVLDPSVPGVEKMHVKCLHILKYGKTLFHCPRCWLLPGFCVCERIQRLSPKTHVVVHMHHLEWSKASNTGCIIHLTVEGSEMLMKGHKEHDARLMALFNDPNVTTAVLWPGEDSVLPSELKQIADERTQGRIAVVAVDATWSNAMRTKGSYPKNVLQVRLNPESALTDDREKSLLYPVRKYRGDVTKCSRVSTLEAVASLLYDLEGDEDQRRVLLNNLRIKVDACLAQKNLPAAYGTTLTAED